MNNRLKLTLILLTLLFIGVAAKADIPCHVAIEIQDSTIKELQYQLAIAQSKPYNQGYQDGYKVASLKLWQPKEVMELVAEIGLLTIVLIVAYGKFIAPNI